MTHSAERLERALHLDCNGELLCGIVHGVETEQPTHGVVIVVGGPQYRVGSHRQFLLLARHLAANDIPVLRFDYRGMGDSDGDIRDFEQIHDDLTVAVTSMKQQYPQIHHWTLWGLCDAATASAFFTAKAAGVDGLVLLNPWVRTESGESRAFIKHYYLKRFFSAAFWKKLLSGKLAWSQSIQSLGKNVQRAYDGVGSITNASTGALPERMLAALRSFNGSILFILSGNDLTAKEFEETVQQSSDWQNLMRSGAIQTHRLTDADHTFSRRVWRDEVACVTTEWVKTQ